MEINKNSISKLMVDVVFTEFIFKKNHAIVDTNWNRSILGWRKMFSIVGFVSGTLWLRAEGWDLKDFGNSVFLEKIF